MNDLAESVDIRQNAVKNITLHSVDGTLTTKGESLYRVIDGLADEELFEKEEDEKAEGKIIEKEKAETGNVSQIMFFMALVYQQALIFFLTAHFYGLPFDSY